MCSSHKRRDTVILMVSQAEAISHVSTFSGPAPTLCLSRFLFPLAGKPSVWTTAGCNHDLRALFSCLLVQLLFKESACPVEH